MSVVADFIEAGDDALQSVLDFVFLIAPGIAVLYRYNRTLILNLDVFKLILLASTITMPVFLLMFTAIRLINFLGYFGNDATKKEAEEFGNDQAIFIALIFSNMAMFMSLFGSYLWRYSPAMFIGIAIIIALSILLALSLFSVLLFRYSSYSNKSK